MKMSCLLSPLALASALAFATPLAAVAAPEHAPVAQVTTASVATPAGYYYHGRHWRHRAWRHHHWYYW